MAGAAGVTGSGAGAYCFNRTAIGSARMNLFRVLAAAIAAIMLTSAAAAHDFGPAVGARIPDPVRAQDGAGATRSFDTLKGENGLVLVFARSADWCPFCQAQLIELERIRGDIEARGWKLAALTTDTPEEIARFTQRRGVAYPILADPDSRIVRAFDLVDPQYPPGHRVHGVPVPTIYFLSPDGVIRAQLGDADYRVRPAADAVLQTLARVSH